MLRVRHFVNHVCLHYPHAIDRHEWSSTNASEFWTCIAAQHVFCSAIPKHENICCMWNDLNDHHGPAKVLNLDWIWRPQPLHSELLSHCSCHMPGRCNDCQRGARHNVFFWEHLLFVPWQVWKDTLGQFKRLWFWLLLHWYEHPNHKLHAYSLQYLGISEYLIPLSQIVLTCSNPSHSPEDAVILIVLRRMSLSNLYFPGLNLTFLDLIATFAIHHPPTSWQTYTKVTEKALFSFWKTLPDQRHCQIPLQTGPWTQYAFHCCHKVVF